MAKVKTFRDLIAWQRAMELVAALYEATLAMPNDERFGLTSQIRRSAVSIPSNIAEGHARQSRADYLRFLRMARGSLAEVSTQYELCLMLHMIRPHDRVASLLSEQERILQALIRSLENMENKASH